MKSNQPVDAHGLDLDGLLRVLELVRELAKPFDLEHAIKLVIEAGRSLLGADRGTMFLYDAAAAELYSTVATSGDSIRFPVSKGLAGECASTLSIITVRDCYDDPRFNPEFDIATGYRTRSMINVPLVDIDDDLVGVLQLMNPQKSHFDATDERIAAVLADQVATAIQRARLVEDRQTKLDLEHDIALARDIQQRVLPTTIGEIRGYELAVFNRPADATGGDIYDIIPLIPRGSKHPIPTHGSDPDLPVVILVADATGHGIGPALSVTQARSMLRMALRFDGELDSVITEVNNQLCSDLDRTRFVAAFVGMLDPTSHQLDYHACGQGPVLHFHAPTRDCDQLAASTVPLGVIADLPLDRPAPIVFAEGDIVLLLTDGFYECYNPAGEMLGVDAVISIVSENRHCSATELLAKVVEKADRFANGAAQADDLTAVILKRT